jgi:hypothetical protein
MGYVAIGFDLHISRCVELDFCYGVPDLSGNNVIIIVAPESFQACEANIN